MKYYFNIILIILVILLFCKSFEGWADAESCESSTYPADSFCPEEGCTDLSGATIPGVPGGTSVTGRSSLGYYDCLEIGSPVCGTGECGEIQSGNFQCVYPGTNREFSMGTFQTPAEYCAARERYSRTPPRVKSKGSGPQSDMVCLNENSQCCATPPLYLASMPSLCDTIGRTNISDCISSVGCVQKN